jgi:hypothetical protein
MKMVMLSFFLVMSVPVFANEKTENLYEVKAKLTERLEKRIAQLQETKSCIASATTKEDLKKCREKNKMNRQGLHKKHGKNQKNIED